MIINYTDPKNKDKGDPSIEILPENPQDSFNLGVISEKCKNAGIDCQVIFREGAIEMFSLTMNGLITFMVTK